MGPFFLSFFSTCRRFHCLSPLIGAAPSARQSDKLRELSSYANFHCLRLMHLAISRESAVAIPSQEVEREDLDPQDLAASRRYRPDAFSIHSR